MRRTIVILSALSSVALAQDKTFEFFWPVGAHPSDPVASIKIANPSSTIVDITCATAAPDYNPYDCGWGPGPEYSVLSQTIHKASLTNGNYTMTFSCDGNTSKQELTCGISVNNPDYSSRYTENTVLAESERTVIDAMVTAGGEMLSATEAGQVGTVGTAPKTSTSPRASESAATGQAAVSTASTTDVSPQNTSAACRFGVESSALLALAGAAALNAL